MPGFERDMNENYVLKDDWETLNDAVANEVNAVKESKVYTRAPGELYGAAHLGS